MIKLSYADEVRFWLRVEQWDVCWNWIGSTQDNGYGRFAANGERYMAHRVAYVLIKGQIPDELDIHHVCGNIRCCNPAHLEPLDRKTHLADRTEAGVAYINRHKTQCVHGHPFTEENTYWHEGHRQCKICRQRRLRKFQESKATREGRVMQVQVGKRTHCPKGHPYDEGNTLHYAGRRVCRACRSISRKHPATG